MVVESVKRHTVEPVDRPLSPHLQAWRWAPTMLTSILNRVTGVGNAAGFLLIAIWIGALAGGPGAYAAVTDLFMSAPGLVVLIGVTWSVSFHLLAGLRHIAWDLGAGFAVKTATGVSWAMLIGSVVLTGAAWALALTLR